MSCRFVVTGGAGFIGSELVRRAIARGHAVLNIDLLTYASSAEALSDVVASPSYSFRRLDVADRNAMIETIFDFDPDVVFHLAAETHVDRSIEDPHAFVRTNVTGTCAVLDASLNHWRRLDGERRAAFRHVHVSTDEVFGSLGPTGHFTEDSAYRPNSPYSASKAAADHFARAWAQTYGLPVIVTNCSNNYGPWQHPEKLIPTVVRSALAGAPIPIYGTGQNVRDWLYVADHAEGLVRAAAAGKPGETYVFGGGAEASNLDLARRLCATLDRLRPRADGVPYASQITFVADRPGHDWRYAIDAQKARSNLGWNPQRDLDQGLEATVRWYLANPGWFERSPSELGRRGLLETGGAPRS